MMNIFKILCASALKLLLLNSCTGGSKIIKRNGLSYLVDLRGRYHYRIVSINGKLWTTTNVIIPLPGSSFFPSPMHNPETLHGRTYNWEAAQQACPKGWRLPTSEELADLFLGYGKVAYAGESPYFISIFGPYEPDSTHTTFQAMLQDKTFRFPMPPITPDVPGYNIQRTLFWSSDTIDDKAYAVHWDAQSGVHFSAYPKSYFGFCRFVKKGHLKKH